MEETDDMALCEELFPIYPRLSDFYGGLLSRYASTARVEAAFSTLKNIKVLHRQKLSNTCMMGEIYARQWPDMNLDIVPDASAQNMSFTTPEKKQIDPAKSATVYIDSDVDDCMHVCSDDSDDYCEVYAI